MLKNCQMFLKSVPVAIVGALLLSAGLHAQTYTDLYDFSCDTGGCSPVDLGQLTQGFDGNLYGTTRSGGGFGYGTIFMVTPYGAHADLWSFDGVSGAVPYGGLTLASDGNFYGTATLGGAYRNGTVFRFTPPNTVTVLHSFNGSDGANPAIPPTQGADANLYGVSGSGTTYRIALPSGIFQQLAQNVSSNTGPTCQPISFIKGDPNCYPYSVNGPLYLASDGNLYGTSFYGGDFGAGSVFRITTDGDITDVYSFTGGSDGYGPIGPVTQG